VREAVINAVVHSDYARRGAPIRLSISDDRLEVENPDSCPSASRSRIFRTASPNCATA
jgi:predicted HTH transcriptional regulator